MARAAVLAVCATPLVACGDSNGASDSADAPIKVMQILDTTSQNSVSFPEMAKVGDAVIAKLNAGGGVDGRKIELLHCDSKTDPNVTIDCARKAVQEKVVAVVGVYAQNADKLVAVLKQAKIPYLPAFPTLPAEFDSPNSFALAGAIIVASSAMGVVAGRECNSVATVDADSPAADFIDSLAAAGLKTRGKKPVLVAKVPLKPGDYSAEATEIADSGADCVVSNLAPPHAAALYPALVAAGSTQRIIGFEGSSLSTSLIGDLPGFLENAVNVNFFVPSTDPAWKEYHDTLDKFGDPDKFDFTTPGTKFAYCTFHVLAQALDMVLSKDQAVDSASVLEALGNISKTDTGGLMPDIDLTSPAPIKEFTRLFGRTVSYEVVKDGKITPLGDGTFEDLTPVLQSVLGTP
jgi:ABC-type branched-subunit amino acid transport system substrate-binding protein